MEEIKKIVLQNDNAINEQSISYKFKPVIEEIENAIKYLETMKETIIMLDKNLVDLKVTETTLTTELAVNLLFKK